MTFKEIEDILARPETTDRHRRILADITLEMRIMNASDSKELDRQLLVALIQKEPIS
jgi:hypothetical protein